MLSLLSYNIYYGKKLAEIILWLSQLPPVDIICFQEFPKEQIPVFLREFSKQNFEYCYAEGFSKHGISYGELTLFNNKKLKLLKHSIVELGGNRFEDTIFNVKTARTSLLTTFHYKNSLFTIANTHLVCVHNNSMKRKQLTQVITSMEGSSGPRIILGDFNYSSLYRQNKFMKFMTQHNFTNAYRINTHRLYYIPHQVDYIFYRDCMVSDISVPKVSFSDHKPTICTLSLSL